MSVSSVRSRLRTVALEMDRRLVAVGIVSIGAAIVGTSAVAGGLENYLPLYYLYGSLVAGNVTLITIVVSINQLVLSRDFGSPGQLRDEIRQTIDFHRSATNRADVPFEPTPFFRASIVQLEASASALERSVAGEETELTAAVSTLTGRIDDHVSTVRARLEGDPSWSPPLLALVVAVLPVRYMDFIRSVQRVQSEFANELSSAERTETALEEVRTELEQLDVARYYFVSMAIQRDLSRLSQSLLYTGVPAIFLSIAMLVRLAGYETTAGAESTIGLTVVAVLTLAVGLLPIGLLTAYAVRISIVARHVSITPFDSRLEREPRER
ncbi:hypothetical protein [Halobiforma nitratireducens]|uniref:Uncharacterized protein n=1 Tax=Halobiforma nitratireducens JCM 10879 TaxID=1227454 RepID=M0LCY3_9EURY|nr:hypothetical protein [Halobiforma nitratireducens]EMA31422.1 hypothetical protein C446_15683 [Halobiforma nitratireducens JCM 10879]